MNQKGQALLEFVIIIPILLLVFTGMIDVGRIYYSKLELENKSSDALELYREEYSEEEIKDLLDFGTEEFFLEISGEKEVYIKLSREIKLYTPGIAKILDDPYSVEVTRISIK